MSESANTDGARPPGRLRFLPGILTGVVLLAVAVAVFHRTWRIAAGESAVAQEADRRAASISRIESGIAGFIDSQARPLLREGSGREREAVRAAVDRMDQAFARYAEGVDAFTRDLTGWGTRFRLVWRKGVETAERKDEHSWTAALVQEKFGEHVVSAARLEADVLEVTRQFAYDIEAARNELLATLTARLEASALPVDLRLAAAENFAPHFEAEQKRLLASLPVESVAIGAGSLTAGIVVEEAVRQMVRAVIAQAAVRLASSAAVSGGAAATSVAAGGAGGTAIAPGVGTAIGLAGGFLAGAVIDWWMTDQFEEKVRAQCLEFLGETRDALVSGAGGMEALFSSEADRAASAWERAVLASLQASAAPAAAGSRP